MKAIKIKIPKEVQGIMSELQKRGFEAYVVGGCVRDILRGVAAQSKALSEPRLAF